MKTLKLLFAFFMVVFLINGCAYNFIIPEEVPDAIDPDDPNAPQISFAAEIETIFNNNNKCTACHDGGQNPNLTTDNAFASINSTRYINSTNPEESKIYGWAHPDTDSHKQLKYTAAEAAKVLLWIGQGAKEN